MNRNHKRLLSGILALLIACFAGCGGTAGEQASVPVASAPTAEQEEMQEVPAPSETAVPDAQPEAASSGEEPAPGQEESVVEPDLSSEQEVSATEPEPEPEPVPEPELENDNGILDPFALTAGMEDSENPWLPFYVSWVKNAVYLRSSPSAADDSNILATIPAGEMVRYYYASSDNTEEFRQVIYQGQTGYVKGRYLTHSNYGSCGDATVWFDQQAELDLDGDGITERLVIDDFGRGDFSAVVIDEGREIVLFDWIVSPGQILTADATGDGYPEMFIIDYGPSDDLNMCCYSYTPSTGTYRRILFEQVDGARYQSVYDEETDTWEETGGGIAVSVNGTSVTVAAIHDIFETVNCVSVFQYDGASDMFVAPENQVWYPNVANTFVTAQRLPVQIGGNREELPVGTEMKLTEFRYSEDGTQVQVTFYLRDGTIGTFDAERKNWECWIDGKPGQDFFQQCFFAD